MAVRPEASLARADSSSRTLRILQVRVTVLRGASKGRTWILSGDVIRIGKAAENDVALPEETVSRVHCEILRDEKGYLLRDLHSTNGTFLDGAEIREAYIRPGSMLAVGTVQLRFQPFEERLESRPSDKTELCELRGGSRAMREIFSIAERVAPMNATVLIEGEPGTGKTLLARALHALSPRAAEPLVSVDCTEAVGPSLESDLFGHEKGAFPQAGATRQGAFEGAQRGTLVLREPSELSLPLQEKLLRVLEQRELRRLGGNRTIKLDVRLLVCSRRNLERERARGRLLEGLFSRVAALPLRLPALRERREDLPLIVEALLLRKGKQGQPSAAAPPAWALDSLAQLPWPGNISELAEWLAQEPYREPGGAGPAGEGPPKAASFEPDRSYREQKERWEGDFERRYLGWLLRRADGNISRAAREADMDRKYLHKLLKKHNLLS